MRSGAPVAARSRSRRWCPWLRGVVVVTALAATAATVKTAYEAGFIAHKNPLLMRETVPPADSIPARPTFGPRPPE